MELWDAYTRDGVKTGEILVRDEPIPAGRYHLVCEVLVRHVDGSYLCMIRSRQKPNYPLYPECTAGGSALMGDDPLCCIRRELFEQHGGFREDYTHGEDTHWVTKLWAAGVNMKHCIPEPLYLRRIHNTNISLSHHKTEQRDIMALMADAIRQTRKEIKR